MDVLYYSILAHSAMQVVAFYVVLVILFVPSAYSYVSTDDLFPFGIANGDARLPTSRGNYVNVSLSPDRVFKLFDSSYSNLFVNTIGAISVSKGKHHEL